MLEKAKQLYLESIDFDFADYEETKESDILFIAGLIDAIGEADTRKVLKEMLYD